MPRDEGAQVAVATLILGQHCQVIETGQTHEGYMLNLGTEDRLDAGPAGELEELEMSIRRPVIGERQSAKSEERSALHKLAEGHYPFEVAVDAVNMEGYVYQ
jgi:hypothetical protein